MLSLMAAAIPCAAAAECIDRDTTIRAAFISNLSKWREFDSSGRKLVSESGTLQGAELSTGLRCGGWDLVAKISQSDGSRQYEGQMSPGVLISSHSVLRNLEEQVQAKLTISDHWQLGARWLGQTTWREIASAGGASGYPERYHWRILSVGALWRTALGPGQLRLATWAGKSLDSSMDLNLPGRDQARLTLGSITQLELEAGWEMPLSPSWHLLANIRYRRTEMGQGAASVIRRDGVAVGVAHQPRTAMIEVPIALLIAYRF